MSHGGRSPCASTQPRSPFGGWGSRRPGGPSAYGRGCFAHSPYPLRGESAGYWSQTALSYKKAKKGGPSYPKKSKERRVPHPPKKQKKMWRPRKNFMISRKMRFRDVLMISRNKNINNKAIYELKNNVSTESERSENPLKKMYDPRKLTSRRDDCVP